MVLSEHWRATAQDERASAPHLLVGWMLLAVTAVLAGGDLYLLLTQATPAVAQPVLNVAVSSSVIMPAVVFAVMGLIVVWRRPRNRAGWVMCAIGFTYAIGLVTTDFPDRAYRVYHIRGAIYLGSLVIGNTIWPVFLLCLAALLFLYPTGTSLSERWSQLLRWGMTVSLTFLLTGLFASGRLSSFPKQNPVGLSFVPAFLGDIAQLPSVCLLLISVAGIARRFWLSRGEERQQLKLFTYSAGVTVVLLTVTVVTGFGNIVGVAYFLTLSAVPVAIGVAILKYRLWDIDVLINRTLVYGLLSVMLGAIYIGGVLGMQTLFGLAIGHSSTFAVALSTLAIIALFRPLRARVQDVIDRRFYRHKYDGQKMLIGLNERLRDETDLERIRLEILSVLHATMEPTGSSLWLPHPGEGSTRAQ